MSLSSFLPPLFLSLCVEGWGGFFFFWWFVLAVGSSPDTRGSLFSSQTDDSVAIYGHWLCPASVLDAASPGLAQFVHGSLPPLSINAGVRLPGPLSGKLGAGM